MRLLSACATCSGRTPIPTMYPMIHFLPGSASTTFNCQGAWIGRSVLNTAFKALCAFTWRNCVTRVGNSRRCCTRLRIKSVTCPARSGRASIFAAATASWIARLIPTPPAGDIVRGIADAKQSRKMPSPEPVDLHRQQFNLIPFFARWANRWGVSTSLSWESGSGTLNRPWAVSGASGQRPRRF